jgi:chromosome segregation ATPase
VTVRFYSTSKTAPPTKRSTNNARRRPEVAGGVILGERSWKNFEKLDAEIVALKEQIADREFQIDELRDELLDLEEESDELEEQRDELEDELALDTNEAAETETA